MQMRAAEVDQSFLAQAAKGDPDKVIDAALTDSIKMAQLQRATSANPGALKRALWDHVLTQGGDGDMPDGEKMLNYISANEKPLTRVFGDKHLSDLKDISTMYGMMGRVPLPKGQPINTSTMKAVESAMGQSYPSMMSQLRAWEQRRTSGFWTGFNFLRSRMYSAGNKEAERQLRAAFYDPAAAKSFTDYVSSSGKNQLAGVRLRGYMGAVGVGKLAPYYSTTVPQKDDSQ
jgi:hypothetical protein